MLKTKEDPPVSKREEAIHNTIDENNDATSTKNDGMKGNAVAFTKGKTSELTVSASGNSNDSPLNVVICTANIGNAAPTPASIAALIPKNGRLSDFVQSDDASAKAALKEYGLKSAPIKSNAFADIIAVGMQEAFFSTSNPSGALHNPSGALRDISETLKDIPQLITFKSTFQLPLKGLEAAREELNGGSECLNNLLEKRCPAYTSILHFQRGEMRLILLVRKDIVPDITALDCKAENTGIGSVLPNKGGIVATLTVRQTRIAFVNAHLEAHEGEHHYLNRCKNITDILSGARVGPRSDILDASLSNHHCFCFGDLNFRVKLPGTDQKNPPGDENMKKKAHFSQVMQLVDNEDWDSLNAADELFKALRQNDCLAQFRTCPCRFPPTFKVEPQKEGFVYQDKRTPSYCDRILWKSLDGLEENVTPIAYHPCPSFITSDHKPVRGAFSIKTNTTAKHVIGSGGISNPEKLNLIVSDMQATNLYAYSNSESLKKHLRVYMCFIADPKEIISTTKKPTERSHWPKTSSLFGLEKEHIPRTKNANDMVNPNWEQEEVHLEIDVTEMNAAMLYINVVKCDSSSILDYLVGTSAINIRKLISKETNNGSLHDSLEGAVKTINVEEPLLKNGKITGTLKCSISLVKFKTVQSTFSSRRLMKTTETEDQKGWFFARRLVNPTEKDDKPCKVS